MVSEVSDVRIEELSWLANLAYEFNHKHGNNTLVHSKLLNTLTVCIEQGVALKTSNSAVAGIVMDDPLYDATLLVELGWFATPGDGIPLLDAFIARGRRLNVDEIRFSTLERNKRAGVILKRKGFVPLEHGWGLKIG